MVSCAIIEYHIRPTGTLSSVSGLFVLSQQQCKGVFAKRPRQKKQINTSVWTQMRLQKPSLRWTQEGNIMTAYE
jgi:hypothetical protein